MTNCKIDPASTVCYCLCTCKSWLHSYPQTLHWNVAYYSSTESLLVVTETQQKFVLKTGMAYWRLQIYGFLTALNRENWGFFYPYIIYLYVIFVIAFFIPVLQDLFENLKQNGAVPESDLKSLATKYGINYWGLILFYILLVCQFSICNKRIMIHFAFVVLSTFRKRNPPLNIGYSQYFFFLENPLSFLTGI